MWLYCAIIEGESMDKRDFRPSFIEFKRMVRPSILTKFVPIFLSQYLDKPDMFQQTEPDTFKKRVAASFHKFMKSDWMPWIIGLAVFAAWATFFGVTRFKLP